MNIIEEVKMSKLNKIQKIALAIIMAVAVAAPIALAQSAPTPEGSKKERRAFDRGPFDRGHRGGLRGLNKLDLSDAQKDQLRQIRETHRQTVAPIVDQIRAKRAELRSAAEGGTFNEALVAQKLSEIAPLEAKLMGEQFRLRQQMLTVLTPEQKTQLEQMREQVKSKRSGQRTRAQRTSA